VKRTITILLGLGIAAATAGPAEVELRRLLGRLHPERSAAVARLDLGGDLEAALRRIDPWARVERPEPVGDAAGIGAELVEEEGHWRLVPWAGGPLHGAGIHRRVTLLAVDDQPAAGMDREALARRLRGDPGSRVCLQLQREEMPPFRLCLVRNANTLPAVEALAPGMLRVRRFRTRETRPALRRYLENEPPEALILDLTECTGGELYEALDSAALFLPPGTPLAELEWMEDGRRDSVVAPSALPTWSGPVVLLVGPDTASACEIFAGVLRVARRAALVGGPTRGKCTSQRAFTLSDGTRVWLSNLRVRFADGSSCEGAGVGAVGGPPEWVHPAPGANGMATANDLHQ